MKNISRLYPSYFLTRLKMQMYNIVETIIIKNSSLSLVDSTHLVNLSISKSIKEHGVEAMGSIL